MGDEYDLFGMVKLINVDVDGEVVWYMIIDDGD